MKKLLLGRWALALVLIVLPLGNLWLRPIAQHGVDGKAFFAISYWYEAVLLIAIVLGFGVHRLKLLTKWTDYFALGVIILASMTIFWSHRSIGDEIVGLRYCIPVLCAYFAARLFDFDLGMFTKIARIILPIVVVVAFVQLLVWQFSSDGFLDAISWQREFQIPGNVSQVYSSFAGPNQLASYLIVLSMFLWRESVGRYSVWIYLSWFLIVLTYSRSALLGLLVALLYAAFIDWKEKGYRSAIPLLGVLLVFGVTQLAVTHLADVQSTDVFTHGESQTGHVFALRDTADRMEHSSFGMVLFGHGAGTAGPASIARPPTFIPESWILQILYEIGLVGLAAYLLFFAYAFKFSKARAGVQLAIVGILINALFLHILADNLAMAVTFGILIGAMVNLPDTAKLKRSRAH